MDYMLLKEFQDKFEYTKKFKPVKIEKRYYNCEEELKYTLEYMEKYFKAPKDNKNAEIPQVADLEYGMEHSM